MTAPTLEEAAHLLTTELRPNRAFLCVGVADVPGEPSLVVYYDPRKSYGTRHPFPAEWHGYPVRVTKVPGGFKAC